MKQLSLPNYTEINQALSKTALELHASQVHGLICGIICGNAGTTEAWDKMLAGGKVPAGTQEVLQALYDMSVKQLNDFLFEFQLVLPPDSDPLQERAEALTVWCQGFLTGLEMVNVQLVGRQAGEVTEAINDLIEIAKINYEDVVDGEEDEGAYIELVEYVRMAIILINQDLRESASTKKMTGSSSSHLH